MAEPVQLPLFPEMASLVRIRPERNEWRYYRMTIWKDLFGGALLARHWGRIGTPGRVPGFGSTVTLTPAPPATPSPGCSAASVIAATATAAHEARAARLPPERYPQRRG